MSDVETAQTGAEVAPVEGQQATNQAPAQESTTEHGDAQRQDQPRDDKGRFVPQERVNEITRARRTAERNWEAAERRAQDLERQLATFQSRPTQSQDSGIPEFDYADPTAWAQRVVQYATDAATRQTERRAQESQSQQQRQQAIDRFGERENQFRTAQTDYDEVVNDLQGIRFQPEVIDVIAASDIGPAVLYHLASHLDEADRIARMSPHLAAVQLGRIEAQLAAPKPKPVTKAPDPAPVIGGGAAATKDPERMSTEDWMAWRRTQQ